MPEIERATRTAMCKYTEKGIILEALVEFTLRNGQASRRYVPAQVRRSGLSEIEETEEGYPMTK
jgi:hypothetical protein